MPGTTTDRTGINHGLASLAGAIGVVLVGVAVGLASGRRAPLARIWAGFRCRMQRSGIRWSGSFLRSMGAVDSAPRAEQDALRAQRVACALADHFQERGRDLSVRVIGGVIHLEGLVASRDDMAEAEEIARAVSGTGIVADDLGVVTEERGVESGRQVPSP